MMATINHCFCGIQRQMATTIANSICDALDQKITPLLDDIMMLVNCLDATTAKATKFASTIRRKISDTITPLSVNISTLCNCLNALDDGTRNNATIADASTLASTLHTNMAATVNQLRDNLTAMEACLTKRLDDFSSHMNHITKAVIPDAEDKIYHCVLSTARVQHTKNHSKMQYFVDTNPVSMHVPIPMPAKGTPDPNPDGHGTSAPAATITMGQQTNQTTNDEGTPPSAAATPPKMSGTPDFVLPDGHLGSGLGGPTIPIQSEVQGTTNIVRNMHLAHKEGHRPRLAMGPPENPYTPPCHLPCHPVPTQSCLWTVTPSLPSADGMRPAMEPPAALPPPQTTPIREQSMPPRLPP